MKKMTLLIDMLLDSRDVYSRHKFDVGKTRQKFHVTLKPKTAKTTTTQQSTFTFEGKAGATSNTA